MSSEELQESHRHFAMDTFNRCWGVIDKAERTNADEREMLRLAEVSFWHWMQVEDRTAENEGIGLWLLARVYALAGSPEVALDYADAYLKLAQAEMLGAFHEGYAHEAIARGQRAAGRFTESTTALSEARACVEKIDDQESRELLQADLEGLEGGDDRR